MSQPGSGRQAAAARKAAVIFDGRYIQDRYHGIGRYAYHIIKELANLLPGVRFTVLRDSNLQQSRFSWEELAALANVQLQEISAPPFSAREQVSLGKALTVARGSAGLYHTPYFPLPWTPAPPSIITVHDCIFERDARYMPKRWARLYYRLLMQASLKRARAVAVPSKATADDLRRFYRAVPRRVVITPEAADPTYSPMQGAELEEVRRRYSLPDSFILAVGTRRPHKNFALLVRAAAALPAATLVFVGEADKRFRDDTAEAAAGLGDAVRFLGKVPEDDLPSLYNLATALACPSTVEGFGLPLIEAMSCGTPVVCSEIPVFREVAAGAALYAHPHKQSEWTAALGQVLAGRELQEQMRESGLQRAKEASWKRAASALLPVYRAFLGQGQR